MIGWLANYDKYEKYPSTIKPSPSNMEPMIVNDRKAADGGQKAKCEMNKCDQKKYCKTAS